MNQTEFLKTAEKARRLGEGLIDDFAWDNIVMGLDLIQREQSLDALSGVLDAISIGALDIALSKMQVLAPIPVILEQERINSYIAKLQNLAGSLVG